MDKIRAFFASLTLFQWIAVILFPIGLISGLNALLSLKSRYRDWRGIKNLEAFNNRIEFFRKQANLLQRLKKNPTDFFMWLLRQLLPGVNCFLLAFILLLLSFLFPLPVLNQFLLVLTLLLGVLSFTHTSRVTRVTRQVSAPEKLILEILMFATNAKKKGFTSPEADELIVSLTKSELFTETQRKKVFEYIGQHYPSMLSSFMGTSTPSVE
jgi:hypothetical protein